jgi:23S rRNA maturation-related 3'-5' exoribonuclease YhaM
MNKKQKEMCNQKITELSKSITENYERVQYLEKYVDKDYNEDEYDSYTEYEKDISDMENGIDYHILEINKITELINWIIELKNK